MRKTILIALVAVLIFVNIVAVQAQEETIVKMQVPAVTSEGSGLMTEMEVEISPGKGRVLVSVYPLTGFSTQNSEIIATQIAQKYTALNLSDKDTIFTVKTNATAIDGPSAGAAMTAMTIAALEGKDIRKDATITGTILVDGKIGYVGGILEKGKAVGESGIKYYLIPKGQEIEMQPVTKEEHPYPGWTIERTEYVPINVTEYLAENYDVVVLQVENIKQVASILIEGENISIVSVSPEKATLSYTLITEKTEPFEDLAEHEIQIAKENIQRARVDVRTSKLDNDVKQVMHEWLDKAEGHLEKAEEALEYGYAYGAANYAFRATLDSNFISYMVQYESKENNTERTKFIGDSLEKAGKRLSETKTKLDDVDKLARDKGSFEWAVAAQQRLSQADERFSRSSNETGTIFYTIVTVEGWSDITDHLYEIAEENANHTYVDEDLFLNQSIMMIVRASAELAQFGIPDEWYGPEWYIRVAERDYLQGWYLASYLDSTTAVLRLETSKEIELRSWEGLASQIEMDIATISQEVDTENSVWTKVYLDQARLNLYHARKEKDFDLLKDAFFYTRLAKSHDQVANQVEVAEETRLNFFGINLFWVGFVIVVVLLVVIIFLGLSGLHFYDSIIGVPSRGSKKRKKD